MQGSGVIAPSLGRYKWYCATATAEYKQVRYPKLCRFREWLLEPIPQLRGEELRVYLEHLVSWAGRTESMAYEIDNLIEERLETSLESQIHPGTEAA